MMRDLTKNLPDSPGVYLFKGARGEVLYIGKAGNIRRRVSSYFRAPRSFGEVGTKMDPKFKELLSRAKAVDFRKTDTAIEALILEAELIKKLKPIFNSREKDDKSFLYVDITKDKFPQIILSRGRAAPPRNLAKRYGPFTTASHIREALRIIRRIFPFSIHEKEKIGVMKKPCFDYQIGLCPGTCIGEAKRDGYLKDIRNIKLLFEGKKKRILGNLEKEMAQASKELNFERAEKLKRQIFALGHIQDIALISDERKFIKGSTEGMKRIEGYDVSNISGTSAVGSMVVFTGGVPDKDEYRKFRIKTVHGSNDVAMLTEMLYRRLDNKWQLPDLILVDGGRGQVNTMLRVLRGRSLKIPVVGLAKGPTRKKNEVIGTLPSWTTLRELMAVRDEAHRFAIRYHRTLRSGSFINRK